MFISHSPGPDLGDVCPRETWHTEWTWHLPLDTCSFSCGPTLSAELTSSSRVSANAVPSWVFTLILNPWTPLTSHLSGSFQGYFANSSLSASSGGWNVSELLFLFEITEQSADRLIYKCRTFLSSTPNLGTLSQFHVACKREAQTLFSSPKSYPGTNVIPSCCIHPIGYAQPLPSSGFWLRVSKKRREGVIGLSWNTAVPFSRANWLAILFLLPIILLTLGLTACYFCTLHLCYYLSYHGARGNVKGAYCSRVSLTSQPGSPIYTTCLASTPGSMPPALCLRAVGQLPPLRRGRLASEKKLATTQNFSTKVFHFPWFSLASSELPLSFSHRYSVFFGILMEITIHPQHLITPSRNKPALR